jgi:Ca2+-binding RTX toxin-like protein
MYGSDGNDELGGNAGNDSLGCGNGNDVAYASDGDDRLIGDEGYDTLFGESGDDVVLGGGMTDLLYGGDGKDELFGGGGNDFLNGDLGADKFVFSTLTDSAIGTGIDKIRDFSAAQGDKIVLGSIDAISGTAANDAFVWKGMSLPSVATAGNLWGQYFAATVYNPQTVRVYGDVNGDNVADFSIDVQNLTTLDAQAFIL